MRAIYTKKYADAWIKNHESGEDIFRKKYLEPFVKNAIKRLPSRSVVLDVGCGWGMTISFLKKRHEYHGVDRVAYFFDYIKKGHKNKIISLKRGFLPNRIPVPNESADFTICSLTLHATLNLKESLQTLFSKTKPGGRLLIIDFRDSAEQTLRTEVYKTRYEEDKRRVLGMATLPSGTEVFCETYFHKEREIESIIKKYGKFRKAYLGPLFVSYEITRLPLGSMLKLANKQRV